MNWDPASLYKRTHRRIAYVYFLVAMLIFIAPVVIKFELTYGGATPQEPSASRSWAPDYERYQSGGEALARQQRRAEEDRRIAEVMQRFYGFVEFSLLWLLGSAILLSPVVSRGRRHLATSVIYEPLDVDVPYALYLRPFSSASGDYTDRELDALPTAFRGAMRRCRNRVQSSAEGEIRRWTGRRPGLRIRRRIKKLVARHRIIAVADPSGELAGDMGAVALDDRWREDVSNLMRGAHLIILALGSSEGVLWEFRQILDSQLSKTVILLPTASDSRLACIALVLSLVPTRCPREAFANPETMAIVFIEQHAWPIQGRHGSTRSRPVVNSRAIFDYLDGANLLEPPSVDDWAHIVESRLPTSLPHAVVRKVLDAPT